MFLNNVSPFLLFKLGVFNYLQTEKITYSLSFNTIGNFYFDIDQNSGLITVRRSLTTDARTLYNVSGTFIYQVFFLGLLIQHFSMTKLKKSLVL